VLLVTPKHLGAALDQGAPMSIVITPHLNFRGNAREALTFYQAVFGGDLMVVTYADMGAVTPEQGDPATADLVTWGQVSADNGFRVMAYDVYPKLPYEQGSHSFYVSVRGTDKAELRGYWDQLADGATIAQPLSPAPWAPLYGQLTDRYGVTWVLDIAAEYPAI
jgi:PhnB protein